MKAWGYGCAMLLLTSCAQVVPPTGGEKDENPPEVIGAIPPDLSTNFSGNRIEIVFDEYVILNNLTEQLIISPPLPEKPDIYLKKKSLIIDLKGELKPNTTYTLNFGTSVSDVTEGNKAENLTYTFATGYQLDSLWLGGTVVNAFTRLPEKDVLVMLYENANDSTPYLARPDYVTRTDQDGNYRLNHVRPGKYKAFALKDGNQNYKYDDVAELIGFSPNTINLNNTNQLDFSVFENDEPIYVKGYALSPYRLAVQLSQPIYGVSGGMILPLNDVGTPRIVEIGTNDSIVLYYGGTLDKPVDFSITVGDEVIDTLTATIPSGIGPALTMMSEVLYSDHGNKLNLTGSNPAFHESDFDVTISTADSTWTHKREELSAPFLLTPEHGVSYKIFVPEGVYEDIYGNKNVGDTLNIWVKEPDDFGTLLFTISVPDSSFILEITGGRISRPYRAHLRPNWIDTWGYIEPGTYQIRVFSDLNNNNVWDTGNYLEGTQPEPMYYIERDYTIRANWEFDITWSLER